MKRLAWGLVLAAASVATTAMAGGIERLDRLPAAPSAKTKVITVDLRDETACERASLPGARCLPASSLFDETTRPLPFLALRWLLGTIGLTGRESVVLYADHKNAAWAAAGLLYLAGQKNVAVLDGSAVSLKEPGQPRSFSREAVYTAPMRDTLIRLGNSQQTLGAQLAAFARGNVKAITIARPN